MKKSIGIVGGMGPLATADLMQKIVLSTQADSDSEHIRIFVDCNPQIPDRTAAILSGGPDPVPEMLKAVRSMEACGADVLVMPCNTAHHFLPRLASETQTPFISILEATAAGCARRFPGKTAALLGTRGTFSTGIYTAPLAQAGVNCLLPDDGMKDTLMQVIYAVKAGRDMAPLKPALEAVLAALRAQGADYFILGCTELPVAAAALALEGPFVDPTQELAEAAIRWCGYGVRQA